MNDVRAAFFVIRYMKTVIRYIGRAKVFTKKCGMVLSDYRQESKYAVPIKIKRKGKPQEEVKALWDYVGRVKLSWKWTVVSF